MKLSEALPGIAAGMNVEPPRPDRPPTPPPPAEPEFVPSENGLIRYIVTSATPGNQAELIYHNGLLEELKMTGMTYKQRSQFKNMAPTDEALLKGFARQCRLTIVQADYTMTFDMFWNQYGKVFPGKKVNKNRCQPLWEKISKAEQVKAYYGIETYRKEAEKAGRTLFVDPERYLRDKTWQNEY